MKTDAHPRVVEITDASEHHDGLWVFEHCKAVTNKQCRSFFKARGQNPVFPISANTLTNHMKNQTEKQRTGAHRQ